MMLIGLGSARTHAGGFVAAPRYAVGSSPVSVAVGDFNGDGTLDLAVANQSSGTISILLGKGDGTFRDAQHYPVGSSPVSVAVGDFNGDGILDLAVVKQRSNTVSILVGNGDGTFHSNGVGYAVGQAPTFVAVGDFNGDGQLDLAVTDPGTYPDYKGTVSIFLGNGDGTFQATQDFPAGPGSRSVAVGDFNGDGIQDLVVANWGTVSVLLGNGDGTFQAAQNYDVGFGLTVVVVGDFNGDGILDLAVAIADASSITTGGVSILLGNGDGTFQASQHYTVGIGGNGGHILCLSVGDFNGDGHLDLAVLDSYGAVSILSGTGDGTFQLSPVSYPVGTCNYVAVGDFNADGHPDLAVATGPSSVTILMANAAGSFQAPRSYAVAGHATSVVVGDFNGDGIPDLAATGETYADYHGSVTILLGNGDGTFRYGQSYAVALEPVSAAVGDFNGDGILDLAVANQRSATVSILLGNGDGTFQTAISYEVGDSPDSVAVGDFNGDGILDLVVAKNSDGSAGAILLGNGDGTFQRAQELSAGRGATSVAVADLNGDGKADIVTTNFWAVEFKPPNFHLIEDDVRVFLGNGDGTFQPTKIVHGAGGDPHAVVLRDLNGDGFPDMIVSNGPDPYFGDNGVKIFRDFSVNATIYAATLAGRSLVEGCGLCRRLHVTLGLARC